MEEKKRKSEKLHLTGRSRMCFELNTKPIRLIYSPRPAAKHVGRYALELERVSGLLDARYGVERFPDLAKTVTQGEAVGGLLVGQHERGDRRAVPRLLGGTKTESAGVEGVVEDSPTGEASSGWRAGIALRKQTLKYGKGEERCNRRRRVATKHE